MKNNNSYNPLTAPANQILIYLALSVLAIFVVFQIFFELVGLEELNSDFLPMGISAAVTFFVISPVITFILEARFIEPLSREYYPILLSWPLKVGSFFKKKLIVTLGAFSAYGCIASCLTIFPMYLAYHSWTTSLITASFILFSYLAIAATVVISISAGARYHSSALGIVLSFVMPLLLANTFANTLKAFMVVTFFATVFILVIIGYFTITHAARYFDSLAHQAFVKQV